MRWSCSMRFGLANLFVLVTLLFVGCSGKTSAVGTSQSGGASSSGGAWSGGGSPTGGSSWVGPSGVPTTPTFVNGYFTNGVFAGSAFNWLANTTSASTISPDCTSGASCYTGQSSLCAQGTLEADPTYASTAGMGFALRQAPEANAATADWTPTGDGLYVQLTGTTSALRVQLRALGGDTDETKRWCAPVPQGGTGKIPWTSFNNKCWNNSGNYFTPTTPIRWIEITDPSSNVVTTPMDFCLVNVVPYVNVTDAGLDVATGGNISCADWYRFSIPGTNNVLINNVWNKQHANGYPYQQCLVQRATATGEQFGWNWDWSACDTTTSYASPEVVFGRKPWDGGASTSPDLPKRIDAIQGLTLDFGVSVSANPCYNLNATMWLTQTDAAPTAPDPQDITTEVMVRFDNPGNIMGCCTQDATVTLGNLTFDVYHQDAHADASDASSYTWKMVTYISRISVQSTQFDLALVLQDIVKQNLANSTDGVQGVELITEVSGGKGSLWLDRFNVTVH